MWDLKNIMLFICSIIVVILVSMKMANANPVTNWLTNEKNKIVEYQTKSWADSKAQLANTKESILKLFRKKNMLIFFFRPTKTRFISPHFFSYKFWINFRRLT